MNYYKLLNKISDGSKNCIIINDDIYTYDHVNSDIIHLEQKIIESISISKKEIVAIFDKDIYFQFIAFFTLNKMEVIPLILHPSTPYNEMSELIKTNSIRYILDSNNIKKVDNISLESSNIKNQKLDKCVNAVLSSGSTGLPKVFFRTYESWAGFFKNQNEVFNVNKDTVMFFHGPLSFTGNLNSILSVIYEGGTLVTYEGFNPAAWNKMIIKNNVNTMYLVPAKIKAFNRSLQKPITNIKSIFTGSQQLFGDLKTEMKKFYNNASVILYYGASELNYVTYITLEELIKNPISLGKPFKGVQIKEKDGFIYVNSNYFVIGLDKWATVKDTGYINKYGELIFNGRQSDIINKCGNTINLKRIWNKTMKIPYVTNAYVTSYEDKLKEKEIALFIEVNRYITKFDFKKALSKELLTYEMPKKIFILDRIPLNDSGKVDRKFIVSKFNLC